MESLRIGTLTARYHLPAARAAERPRLDRLLAAAVDEPLALALERLGVRPEEEVCLRSVRVPVRLRLGAGDSALVLAWSLALAEAIRDTVAAGDGVVRYGSRRHALADFAAGVARGDLRRAWAWCQLGLGEVGAGTPPEVAALRVAEALAAEEESVVPVLAALAAEDLLAPLAARWAPAAWTALAARALAAAGVEEELPSLPPSSAAEDLVDGHPAASPPAAAGSPLAAALARLPAVRTDPGVARAAAALALLAAEPALACWTAERARARRQAAVADLAERLAGREGHREPEDGAAAPAKPAAPPVAAAAAPDERDDRPESEPPLACDRREGWTEHGGLLFLLGLAGELDVPAALAADPALARRPFRWSLHRLALALAPLGESDPAALAFAGLPPGSPPPSAGVEAPGPDEMAAVEALAGRLTAALAERLAPAWGELALPALRDRVNRRRARVVADPGWIEVHLPLDEVATEIRRARFDLDPGYLPWLGVVLRFVYA